VALIWNFGGLVWALAMAVTEKSAFGNYPVTVWTSGLLLVLFTAATGYFLTYFVEYLYDMYAAPGDKALGKTASPFFQRVGVVAGDPLVPEGATEYDWKVIAP